MNDTYKEKRQENIIDKHYEPERLKGIIEVMKIKRNILIFVGIGMSLLAFMAGYLTATINIILL